jgi:spoIIIJ-associated protein
MEWIEVTARTLEEAKELALDRLGVVEAELEFEVLDEPKGGLFGLRRADARIRARVKPLSREKPNDRRRRRGGRPERGGGGGPTRGTATQAGAKAPPPEAATERPGASRQRGGRGRSGTRRPSETANGERPQAQELEQVEVQVDTVPMTIQAEHAARFTEELVRSMGCAASVKTEIGDDEITVSVEGSALGVLVGPKGVTLHALEEVVRAAVQHHAGGHSARLHVDVGGYRERRRAALAEFARQVAAEVLESGEARSLEPMAAPDRKLVHDVIAEVEGVATFSEGEEPRRRVVVRPE